MTLGKKLSAPASMLVVAGLAAYPLLVYFGLRRVGVTWIAAGLLILCVARLIVSSRRDRSAPMRGGILVVCAGGILLAAASVVRQSPDAMLLYPVLVNVALLAVFAGSLLFPPPIVERIARLAGETLSVHAIAYTRKVTLLWAAFFMMNGAVALYTAVYTSMETWALYNGFIAYVLIGMLLGGERIVRALVRRRHSI